MTDNFYAQLPPRDGFETFGHPSAYVPLPPDWLVGVSDIADSTGEIARGGYKSVNMVGAGVISAQRNAHPGMEFPYVFGGDGASFAVPPESGPAAEEALRAVMAWARDAFGLTLRGALLRVADIRTQGLDVRVLRYRASEAVDYAMFSGGGMAWAEAALKAGQIGLDPAPVGAQPDLTGLSCRWANMKARHGQIVSLIVTPGANATAAEFANLCGKVLSVTGKLDGAGHPVPDDGPQSIDAREGLKRERLVPNARLPSVLTEMAVALTSMKTGLRLAGFDARSYAREIRDNADFRKFDDGLKMTLDSDAATIEALRTLLDDATQAGVAEYGLHAQDEAMMTCIVPSAFESHHLHFIDGAAGGYAQAAAQLKGRAT